MNSAKTVVTVSLGIARLLVVSVVLMGMWDVYSAVIEYEDRVYYAESAVQASQLSGESIMAILYSFSFCTLLVILWVMVEYLLNKYMNN